MAYDIYGQNLAPGACEVHPHINQEYPCSQCLADKDAAQRRKYPEPDYKDVRIRELEAFVDWLDENPSFLNLAGFRRFEMAFEHGGTRSLMREAAAVDAAREGD